MELIYNVADDSVEITIGDSAEKITLNELFTKLPQTEKVRIEYLLSEIFKLRRRIAEDMGDYTAYIMGVTKRIAINRGKMEALDPADDAKAIKSLAEIVKACSHEKNTLREMRHAIKLLAITEGRFENELSKIEV